MLGPPMQAVSYPVYYFSPYHPVYISNLSSSTFGILSLLCGWSFFRFIVRVSNEAYRILAVSHYWAVAFAAAEQLCAFRQVGNLPVGESHNRPAVHRKANELAVHCFVDCLLRGGLDGVAYYAGAR